MTFDIFTGLGGSPHLIDVGGVPYLMPIVKKDKVSNSNFNTESEIKCLNFIISCAVVMIDL